MLMIVSEIHPFSILKWEKAFPNSTLSLLKSIFVENNKAKRKEKKKRKEK